jgi:hypothetical protein
MKNIAGYILILFFLCLNGCSENENVGTVCLGDNLDTLFESLPWETKQLVKKGDIIATKNPGLWLDFNYPVAYNDYNTAFGKFAGLNRNFLTTNGEILTREQFAKRIEAEKSKNK